MTKSLNYSTVQAHGEIEDLYFAGQQAGYAGVEGTALGLAKYMGELRGKSSTVAVKYWDWYAGYAQAGNT